MALAHLQGALDTPVWVAPPGGSKERAPRALPRTATPAAEVYETFRTHVLPYGVGNVRPAFFGWVHGAGNAEGVLGELMAAFMKLQRGRPRPHGEQNWSAWSSTGARTSPGLPAEASGLLTSGTSMATVLAIATARHVHADGDIGREGVAVAGRGLVGYASTEAHSCIAKAFDLLGLGRNAPARRAGECSAEMDIAALEAMIAADRAAGLKPFVVAATVGTVNTGAIDDIAGIGALAHREGMWFHVDAAFGIGAQFSEAHKAKAAPMARADSIAFDFHKWFQVPYDAGIVLIRDAKAHYETFAGRKEYLASSDAAWLQASPGIVITDRNSRAPSAR